MEMELLTLSAPLIHLCRPTLFSTVSEIFFNSTNYYKSWTPVDKNDNGMSSPKFSNKNMYHLTYHSSAWAVCSCSTLYCLSILTQTLSLKLNFWPWKKQLLTSEQNHYCCADADNSQNFWVEIVLLAVSMVRINGQPWFKSCSADMIKLSRAAEQSIIR